jgi:hypothetical protein
MMKEDALLVKIAELEDEVRELSVRLEACHLIAAKNFVELTTDRWRPRPWVDLEGNATT